MSRSFSIQTNTPCSERSDLTKLAKGIKWLKSMRNVMVYHLLVYYPYNGKVRLIRVKINVYNTLKSLNELPLLLKTI